MAAEEARSVGYLGAEHREGDRRGAGYGDPRVADGRGGLRCLRIAISPIRKTRRSGKPLLSYASKQYGLLWTVHSSSAVIERRANEGRQRIALKTRMPCFLR
jgi:hypothetical protein